VKGFMDDRLKDMIETTQKVMARHMAESLYGDNALASFLGNTAPKPSLAVRAKSRLGQFFLKIANSLGEYNDYW